MIGKDEKFTGYTTKSQLITALKRAATSQGRLREKGQLSISFDRKGAKYIKRILEITGDIQSTVPGTKRVYIYREQTWG